MMSPTLILNMTMTMTLDKTALPDTDCPKVLTKFYQLKVINSLACDDDETNVKGQSKQVNHKNRQFMER